MAYADYDPVTDLVIVHTSWNEKALISSVPGARWNAHSKHWVVPKAWSALVILRGVFKQQLELSERLIALAWDMRNTWVDRAIELRTELKPINDDLLKVVNSWDT